MGSELALDIQRISVGIIEDDAITRDRLCRSINTAKGLELTFAVSTVADAVASLESSQPHVLLVDLQLPDGSGVEVIQLVAEKHTDTLALVISALGDESSVVRAIKAGALGYLLKDDNDQVIEASIVQLLEGGSPISPGIARHLIRHFQPLEASDSSADHRADTLSPRELDVLTFASKGYSYQEVAGLLGVSPNTVSSYTKKIYEKLAVNSRTEALFEATRLGLVSPPSRD